MDSVQIETGPPEIVAGDAVTPTGGVFKGRRFIAMEVLPQLDQHAPADVLIRPDPPQEGGPLPMPVPASELVHFFRDGDCPVCGDPAHRRCEPAAPFPQIGWRVVLLEPWTGSGEGDDLLPGVRGVVAGVDRSQVIITIDLDTGHQAQLCYAGKPASFFQQWAVL